MQKQFGPNFRPQPPAPGLQPSALLDAYRFLRFSAFGATAALPLLGAASVEPRLAGRRALGLLGVAAAFHAFAYVHNDLCDLELDRTQPLRAAYPLVRGAISPRAAAAFALACVPLAFALDAWAAAGRRGGSRLALAGAFALLAAYNRWGKGCPLPPLTDAAQGLGWALLIVYGAGAAPGRLTRHLAAYELLLIMLVNGVHGALRDLENDAARGALTTARLLGARPGRGGGPRVTPALAGYALLLQLGMLATLARALLGNLAGHGPGARAWAAAGVGASGLGVLALLAAAARGGAAPADVGMLHLILILSAPVALVAPGMAAPPRAALLLAHTVPLLANGMTWDALRWLARR